MHVIIMSGISGAGKNTYIANNYPDALVVSADNFFEHHGKYIFDPSKLSKAHGICLKEFIRFCEKRWADEDNDPVTIIVNNTNTTALEIAPYYAIASAYAASRIDLVTLRVDPAIAAARNSHGVPLKSCQAMDNRIKSRVLPSHWVFTNVVNIDTN